MNQLQLLIAECKHGFLDKPQLSRLCTIARLFPVLVRTGQSRFICAAQYVDFLTKAIEGQGDYIRDVSFPVGSAERAQAWTIDTGSEGIGSSRGIIRNYNPSVGTWTPVDFNEADCGGVFDGFNVSSDADPGL